MTILRASVTGQADKRMDNTCGRFSMHGRPEEEKLWATSRARCNKWACPKCGPKNARKLRESVIRVAGERELKRFLTLTLDPSKFEGDSVAYINKCWVKLRVYLQRKYGHRVSFIKIMEFQKNGQAHFHILIDRFIPYEWMKKAWQAVGGGGVDIRLIDIHRVAGYLSKYLTKELLINLPKGMRRYSTSKDIKLNQKQKSSGWSFAKYPFESLYAFAKSREIIIDETRDKEDSVISFSTLDSLLLL